jgi:hypothetical protein
MDDINRGHYTLHHNTAKAVGDEYDGTVLGLRQAPFQAEIGDQSSGVVIERLRRYGRCAMSACIVAPGKDARIRNFRRYQLLEPADTVASSPGLLSVAIETVDSDNTVIEVSVPVDR